MIITNERIGQQEIEKKIDEYTQKSFSNMLEICRYFSHSGESFERSERGRWTNNEGKFTTKDSFCGFACLNMILYSQFSLKDLDTVDFIRNGLKQEDMWVARKGIRWNGLMEYGLKILSENGFNNILGIIYNFNENKNLFILHGSEISFIKKSIKDGIPLIAGVPRYLNRQRHASHLIIIHGYDEESDQFIITDPDNEAMKRLTRHNPIRQNNTIAISVKDWEYIFSGIAMRFILDV